MRQLRTSESREGAVGPMDTPQLFNQIAPHYDQWSNVLSGEGIRAWHHFAVEQMRIEAGNRVLDVGCGTGTVTRTMAERVGSGGQVVGLDPSSAMLAEARGQAKAPEAANLVWVEGDGEHLPFADGQFDRVTAQFSLRNMTDWVQGLSEMIRVLKPGGRLVVLEVVQPTSAWGAIAWHSLKAVTRRFGSESLQAYQWLGLSVAHAPTREELLAEAERLGIGAVTVHHWLGDLVLVAGGEKVAARSPVPVRVHDPRIMWAVDGSVTALNAGEWITRYAAPGLPIDIVTVIPAEAVARDIAGTDRERWRKQTEVARDHLSGERFRVAMHVLNGDPGPELVRFAAENDVGLVLLGHKGRSRHADYWVGSVARYVAARTACPVLMLPTRGLQ